MKDKKGMDRRKENNSLASFDLDFTSEQKRARDICHENVVTVLTGKPGTAKTTVAASVAIDLLFRKKKDTSPDFRYHGDYDKIIISRPTVVNGKDMGFLPGDEKEKLAPYMAPVISAIKDLVGMTDAELEKLIEDKKIEIIPLQFMRGHTFKNCVVILDEGQNADLEDFKVVSSRLGKDSKLIVTSDWRQVDLRDRNKSASKWFSSIMKLDKCAEVELTENFRHPLAVKIMDVLLELET